MRLTRRALVQAGVVTLASPALTAIGARAVAAQPAAANWRHGLSLFGDLKYPADFKHFDYVNRGRAEGRHGAADRDRRPSTISTVVAGVKGALAGGIDLIYDTLMAPALDEVSTEYGLIAEAVSYPGRFLLRHLPAARRSADGTTASRSRRRT